MPILEEDYHLSLLYNRVLEYHLSLLYNLSYPVLDTISYIPQFPEENHVDLCSSMSILEVLFSCIYLVFDKPLHPLIQLCINRVMYKSLWMSMLTWYNSYR